MICRWKQSDTLWTFFHNQTKKNHFIAWMEWKITTYTDIIRITWAYLTNKKQSINWKHLNSIYYSMSLAVVFGCWHIDALLLFLFSFVSHLRFSLILYPGFMHSVQLFVKPVFRFCIPNVIFGMQCMNEANWFEVKTDFIGNSSSLYNVFPFFSHALFRVKIAGKTVSITRFDTAKCKRQWSTTCYTPFTRNCLKPKIVYRVNMMPLFATIFTFAVALSSKCLLNSKHSTTTTNNTH